MADVQLMLCLLFVLLESAYAEYCRAYRDWRFGVRTFHCSFGCCGPATDEYCCTGNAGQITGIAFGAICGVALLSAVVCCCIKHVNHRGRVIRPATTTGTYNHTTHANIFVLPSGPITSNYPATYSTFYNNTQASAHHFGNGPGAPLAPAYSQTGGLLPPAYSQTILPVPPTNSQVGVYMSSSFTQTEPLQPPAYNQVEIPIPPAYSQTQAVLPPPYSQLEVSSPNYTNSHTDHKSPRAKTAS